MDYSGKQFPKEVILMLIRWCIAYPLSYRHVEELALERGIKIDHATIQRWVVEYGTHIKSKIMRYSNPVGRSWRLDETYIKVKGKWTYLYRAVDSKGNTIDVLLSEKRNTLGALLFLRKALQSSGVEPYKINSDGSNANEAAVGIMNMHRKNNKETEIEYTKVKPDVTLKWKLGIRHCFFMSSDRGTESNLKKFIYKNAR